VSGYLQPYKAVGEEVGVRNTIPKLEERFFTDSV
jgi:hypothetical protein